MKKLNTSLITTGVGYPPSKKGWDFLMQSYTETIAELVRGMAGGVIAANTPYILYGCVKSNAVSPFAYSEGAIFYNGEVYSFPAIASIAIATSDVCTITTTNDPTADPTTMSDGSVVNVHNIRAIVLSDAASVTNGATQFNFSSCVRISYTRKIVINIGDWDMDADADKNVAHGIADYTKIVSVDAIIIPDIGSPVDGNLYPLGHTSPSLGTYGINNGWVISIDATNVLLNRYATGGFDGTSYNATSFNRGYLVIEYRLF